MSKLTAVSLTFLLTLSIDAFSEDRVKLSLPPQSMYSLPAQKASEWLVEHLVTGIQAFKSRIKAIDDNRWRMCLTMEPEIDFGSVHIERR